MNGEQPYEPSDTSSLEPSWGPPRDTITSSMLAYLRESRPWVRLLSVLGFLIAGIMAVIGLSVLLTGGGVAEPGAPVQPVWMGGLYLLSALIYVFPALYLHRYASAIGRLLEGGGVQSFEEALRHQKSFWKLVGVLALVLAAVWVITVAGALLAT